MGFIDSYKHLEKLCGEVLNDDRRLSAYIDEMENMTNGYRYVSSWNEDDSFSVPVRNSVFHACNEYGAECIDDLVKPFHKAFKEDSTSSFAFRYPEASSLFTNDLVGEVIENMKSVCGSGR